MNRIVATLLWALVGAFFLSCGACQDRSAAWTQPGAGTAAAPGRAGGILGREIATLRQSGFVQEIAWAPDGQRLATTSGDDRKVVLWDLARRRIIRETEKSSVDPPTIAFSPDGQILISASFFDRSDAHPTSLTLLDGHTGEMLRSHPGPEMGKPFWPLYAAATDPNGRYVAMRFGGGPHVVTLYDARTWLSAETLVPPTPSRNAVASPTMYEGHMRFSPDGRHLGLMGTAWDKGPL